MQQQKAVSKLQWYVMAAGSPKHNIRKQPKCPGIGGWKTKCGIFTHALKDSSPVKKNSKSLVYTITNKPQKHDVEHLKKPDTNKYNHDSI